VAVGRTYLLPPLSSGGALLVRPWLRFHIPLIEPDRRIYRIRLSDNTLAAVTKLVTVIRRLQTFRRLHACSGCFRLERSPGGPCTHWKSAALSRRTWRADIRAPYRERLGSPLLDACHCQRRINTPWLTGVAEPRHVLPIIEEATHAAHPLLRS
jgi:hypothetical protein